MNLRSWENKEGKKFNIINITTDVVAVSLEFHKVGIDEDETDFFREDNKERKNRLLLPPDKGSLAVR